MADLSELDQRILDLLGVYQTSAGAWPRLRTLAERLGVSRRHVRRRLAALEGAGYVVRQQTFERDDDPGWTVREQQSRAPGRRTSNLYVLGGIGHSETPKPSSTPRTRDESCPISKPSTDHQPVGGTTPGSEHGTPTDVLGVPLDLAAAPGYEPGPIRITPPAGVGWDHDPKPSELRGVIERAFGDGAKIEIRPRAQYRVPRRDDPVDLETCSTDDLHRALSQLERDTCWDGPCPNGCRTGCATRCAADGRRCHRHPRRPHGGSR